MRIHPRGISLLQLGLLWLMLMASALARANIGLTAEEQTWLAAHPQITLAMWEDYEPISYYDASGKSQGYMADYIRLLESKLDIQFTQVKPVFGKSAEGKWRVINADVVSLEAETPVRLQHYNFTSPILTYPLHLIARHDVNDGLTLAKLKGKKVSVVESYATQEFAETNYPEVKLDIVKNTCEGLQHVAFGQSEAMFTDLPIAAWCLKKQGLINLKVAGQTEFIYKMGMTVRKDWPILLSILQKGMQAISPAEMQQLQQRWLSEEIFERSWFERNRGLLSLLGLLALGSILVLLYAWDSRARNRLLNLGDADTAGAVDTTAKFDRLGLYKDQNYRLVLWLFLALLLVLFGLMLMGYQASNLDGRWFLGSMVATLVIITLFGGYKLGSVARTSLVERLMQRLQAQTKVRQASERQLEETALRLDKQNKAITRLSAILRDSSLADEEKYRWLTELCAYTLDVDRVSLWMLMDDNNTLHMVDLFQQNLHRHSSGTRLHANHYPVYFNALATHRSIAVVDALQDQITAEFRDNYLPENHIGAMLDSTVWFEGQVTGVLCIEHAETSRNWAMDEISFAGAVADQVQALMESSRRKLLEHDLAYQQKHLETLVRARTAAIESNAKLARFLIEKAPVSIVYLNAALEILDANPEAQRLAGMRRDDVIGKNFLDLSQPEERAEQKAIFERVINGEKIHGQRVSYRTRDGRVLELAVSRSMELDSDGNPVIISISQDVSQQKALEESLVRAREAAESADRIKSMFVASMSHELRTPLNSIIGFLGVVLQEMSGPINSVQKDQLGRAYQSAKHLLSLISDVIDISKIEAGFLAVHVESFPLKPVLREIESVVHHLVVEKHLDLTIQCDDNITLAADRKRLYQVILNVVSNAVKYTEKGWVKVSTSISGDWVNIVVQDTGIGMDETDIAKLFKPFVRLDSPLKIKTLGTGLGLYLTHKILTQLLQGKIAVESQPEKGSTFTISLPLKIEESAVDVRNGSVLEDSKP